MMLTSLSLTLANAMIAALPWIRSSAAAAPGPAEPATAPASSPAAPAFKDRVAVVAAGSSEYSAMATPLSVRRNSDARQRIVIFRNGVCILDRGLIEAHDESIPAPDTVQESGLLERGTAAPDGREALLVATRYESRVDVTPGSRSTARDFVRSTTTISLVDPEHPDGRWQVTLEGGRWVRSFAVLSASSGVILTTFVPRTGPTDFRMLDGNGRERLRVPESRAEALDIATTCDTGCFVAADMKLQDDIDALPERGVMIFDVAKGTSWTYGWRYGSPEEPTSWSLEPGGILTVRLPGSTKRFDATGRRL